MAKINPGMWLCVQGKMEPTWDGKDIQLNPYHIMTSSSTRSGRIPPRRSAVELHLHTKMSQYGRPDGHEGGHQGRPSAGAIPAIAITDHGVAQSFPDAWHAAGDKIKILYGVEGYFVNNLDDRIAVHGRRDCGLWTMSSSASILRPPA